MLHITLNSTPPLHTTFMSYLCQNPHTLFMLEPTHVTYIPESITVSSYDSVETSSNSLRSMIHHNYTTNESTSLCCNRQIVCGVILVFVTHFDSSCALPLDDFCKWKQYRVVDSKFYFVWVHVLQYIISIVNYDVIGVDIDWHTISGFL